MRQTKFDDIEGLKNSLIDQSLDRLKKSHSAAFKFSVREVAEDDLEYEEYDQAKSEFNRLLHSYFGLFGLESKIETSDQVQLFLKMPPPKFEEWLLNMRPQNLPES